MERVLVVLSIVIAVVALGVIGFNTVRDPLSGRRGALEGELAAAKKGAGGSGEGAGVADYAALQKSVESKPGLWGPLTAPPAAAAPVTDVSKLVEGIAVLPGSLGSGETVRVRLSTPRNRDGQFYQKGDSVTESVAIQDVTDEAVVLGVKQGGKVVAHKLARP